MEEREGFLPRRQEQIYFKLYEPESHPRGLVALVHGAGEHSGRHAPLAEFLAGRGYAVLLHDLRGHGRSSGLKGHVDRFDDYLDDLKALLDQVPLGGPVFVLGHSLGGLVASAFAARFPESLSGLILSSPLIGLKLVPPSWKVRLAQALGGVLPRLRLASNLPLDKLSHDPEVAPAYRADPYCSGLVSVRWFGEVVRKMAEIRGAAPALTVPALLLLAGDDWLADAGVAQSFFAALGSPDKSLVVYPEAYHEIFNEPCREQAMDKVAAWLDAHWREV